MDERSEVVREREIFCKVKEGEDFNRKNTLKYFESRLYHGGMSLTRSLRPPARRSSGSERK